jgi:hypothetical protein
MIEEDQTCGVHRNEYLVAVDYEARKFGCERCVFEGEDIEPKFISLAARDIKDEFDTEYFKFIENQSGIENLTP